MKNNVSNLEKISQITEIKEVTINDKLRNLFGEDFTKLAEKNSEQIYVYKFEYMSGGHKVVGYLVEPKGGDILPCIIYNRGGFGEHAGVLKMGNLFVGDIPTLALAGYLIITTQYSGNAGSEGVDGVVVKK